MTLPLYTRVAITAGRAIAWHLAKLKTEDALTQSPVAVARLTQAEKELREAVVELLGEDNPNGHSQGDTP